MSNPLLANLDGLVGIDLKNRFAEVRRAAIAAGATVEADAATRVMQVAMRNTVRAMVKGIDARATPPAPTAAAPVPAPRPQSPMRPVAPPRPPVSAPAKAAAPAQKPAAPKPRWTPPPPPVPPPLDPDDDNIPF